MLHLAPGGPHPGADGEEDEEQDEGADAVELLVDDAAFAGGARGAGVGGDADAGGGEEVAGGEEDLGGAVFVATGEHGVAGGKS